MKQKINIGLIGLGVVGEGVYQLIQQTDTIQANIKRIAIKDQLKHRNVPIELITFDIDDILHDDEIDIVIELIDDEDIALKIVLDALKNGKHVISANKKMIANHLEEILAWQEIYPNAFLYEAAVCGSIPIIQTLESYFKHHQISSVQGIVNGSTNYILSKQIQYNYSFKQALKLAQNNGFAESDSKLDIEGYDAVNKLCILVKHSFGMHISPQQILRKGIASINQQDLNFANQYGCTIKLVANAFVKNEHELCVYVLPQLVTSATLLASIDDENNAVCIHSELTGNQFYTGKGAGRFPTSSAVLSDLISILNKQFYTYHQSKNSSRIKLNDERLLHVYVRFSTSYSLQLAENNFEHIKFRSHSETNSFLIGLISIKQLIASTWLHNEDISLLCLPENFNLDHSKQSEKFEQAYA